MAELRKEYRVSVTLSFKTFDKYDTVEFVCKVCGASIANLAHAKLVFSRDTGIAAVVCSTRGREGCSHNTKSMCPQHAEMTALVERMVRRNGGGAR
jgi:hypothetical protein